MDNQTPADILLTYKQPGPLSGSVGKTLGDWFGRLAQGPAVTPKQELRLIELCAAMADRGGEVFDNDPVLDEFRDIQAIAVRRRLVSPGPGWGCTHFLTKAGRRLAEETGGL